MQNSVLKILAICLASLLIFACSSKLKKEQQTVQEEFTYKTAFVVKGYVDSLSNILSSKLNKPEDVSQRTLLDLETEYSIISALILQSTNGKIVRVVPEKFRKLLANSKQNGLIEQNFKFLAKNKRLQFQNAVWEMNGGKYIRIRISLLDENKGIIGVVSVFINSKDLFERIEKKCCFPMPYSLFIINKKGIILYCADFGKTGINLTNAKLLRQYPVLKGLYNKMMENDVSYQISTFQNRNSVFTELLTWYAVPVLNTKWWVSLGRTLEKQPSPKTTNVYLLSSLRTYAVKDTLIDAVIDKDWERAEGILRGIYQLNPHAYAIQLTDETGKIVSGWPPGNRTLGYSYTMKKALNFDNAIKAVLNDKRMRIVNSALIEGGKGKFILMPITLDDKIIGVLLSIELERY